MKKLIISTATILVFCVAYIACKKQEIKSPIPNKTELSNAKSFFESYITSNPVAQKLASRKYLNPIDKMPLWDKAYKMATPEYGEVLAVPLHYSKNIEFTANSINPYKFSLEKQSLLYIFKNAKGNYDMQIALTIPSKQYQENNSANFDGYKIMLDWNGWIISRKKFVNGKGYSLSTQNTSKGSTSKEDPITTCDYTDWYNCLVDNEGNYTDCEYQYSVLLGCTTVDGGGGGSGGGSGPTGSPTEGSPGGNPGNPPNNPNPTDYSCYYEQEENFENEVDGASTASDIISSSTSPIDQFTKNKNVNWTCLNGAGGSWKLISQESGIIKLVNVQKNTWAWVSLTHSGITMSGMTPLGTTVSFSQGTGTPSFTPATAAATNVFYAGMSVDFSVTYTFASSCTNIPIIGTVSITKTKNYTSTIIPIDAKP
jgi:hypothetical protein